MAIDLSHLLSMDPMEPNVVYVECPGRTSEIPSTDPAARLHLEVSDRVEYFRRPLGTLYKQPGNSRI